MAPSRAGIALRQVGLGSESDFAAGTEELFTEVADGRFENTAGQALILSGAATDTLQLELPSVLRRDDAEIVRLSFAARVFLTGATFEMEVGHSDQVDNWQKVDGEDAVELATGKGLTVLTTGSGGQVKVIEVPPSTFTPNGDGINDVAVFSFSVLKVNVARDVTVELYDLAGRRVQWLSETRRLANGLYRISWDGRDAAGDRVSPGIYLARIAVDNDSGTITRWLAWLA
jgi:hypothetical protein